MLSEKVIKELVSTPAFISNASRLEYELRISRKDSSQQLLLELLDHRLRTWTNKDVAVAIQCDLPSLKWKIKYAAKDYYRRINKYFARELEKVQMVANMTRQASNQSEILEALELIPELFKNKATKSWVESVLRVGQRETRIRFRQTPRQFNDKLAKVCKYAHKHRQLKQRSHTKELKLLKHWDELMADQHISDNDIQDFIGLHEEYINEIVNSPQVAYQGRLIKDFANAGKDKYVLVNLMAKREQELKEKINE